MTYEEITPHLNKISKLNLKNNKRKVGWLYVDSGIDFKEESLKSIHCVNVRFGKKFIAGNRDIETKSLQSNSEIVQIEDILNIRSCL
jgi:hypothetical protein